MSSLGGPRADGYVGGIGIYTADGMHGRVNDGGTAIHISSLWHGGGGANLEAPLARGASNTDAALIQLVKRTHNLYLL